MGIATFYPTTLKACLGIVFTHGVRMGGQEFGQAGGGKKFDWAVSHKLRCRKLVGTLVMGCRWAS